jgi:hypothetical protein
MSPLAMWLTQVRWCARRAARPHTRSNGEPPASQAEATAPLAGAVARHGRSDRSESYCPLISGRWRSGTTWLKWGRFSWRGVREVAGFISAITVIAAACVWLAQQWPETEDWRPVDNARLVSLRSIHLLKAVHETFGVPVERKFGPQHTAVEYFTRHNYWLQVIYDTQANSVLGWTVTVCGQDFSPMFAYGPGVRPVVRFWRSTLADIGDLVVLPTVHFLRPNTIHQTAQLVEFGSLPASVGLVGIVWGVAAVCSTDFPTAEEIVF